MSVQGLVSRTYRRAQSIGIRRLVELIWEKYIRPRVDLLFNRKREYVIGQRIDVTVPAFSEEDVRSADDMLSLLPRSAAADLNIRFCLLRPEGTNSPSIAAKAGPIDFAATPRMVLSYALNGGDVLLPPTIAEQHSEIVAACGHLGVKVLRTSADILDRLEKRRIIRFSAHPRSAEYLYERLKERGEAGHYGYTEQLDPDLVAELPQKFRYFNAHCDMQLHSIHDLLRYPGRVSRQYAVGELYRDYLDVDSVLDVGCDIKGVGDRLQSTTRYVGVDFQGLADHIIDLDKCSLPFADREYTTVLCYEVLEHLKDIHGHYDKMMDIADRFFVGSLFTESGMHRGRSVNSYGAPLGNMHLPIARVYDRHQWVFSLVDALDFIYYRARRKGFRVRRLDFFYDDRKIMPLQRTRLRRAIQSGNVELLSRNILLIGYVIEREDVSR